MIFNVTAYLTNDPSVTEIKDYNKQVSTGILIDEEILYLLVVGEFVNHNNGKDSYLKMSKRFFSLKDFNYLTQFLNGFSKKTNYYITPHIFTKFIHLLWDNVKNADDYEKIIKVFETFSNFIKERNMDKEKFLKEDNFKKMKWDLVNSSLILTSKEHNHNTILTCKTKTNNLCNESGCLVIHYEDIKSAFITNYYN